MIALCSITSRCLGNENAVLSAKKHRAASRESGGNRPNSYSNFASILVVLMAGELCSDSPYFL